MINTKIGSRWHCINRAHLQIPLDPLLPIGQEFPRLSAYDRAYSGSYHVDLYYRPVSRWMMGHAVKAKRKWLKEDKTWADSQAEIWLLLFKRLIALHFLHFPSKFECPPPPLNPSKVFSHPPFWVLSYDWFPLFFFQKSSDPPKILPPPQAINNDRSFTIG